MIALLGGFGAALLWGTSTVTSSRGARAVGAVSWLAGVMSVGLVVVVPFVGGSRPDGLRIGAITWLVVSGVGNVAGLLLTYVALRGGDVAVVAPLLSTEGAIAALFAVAGGEHLRLGAALALVVVAVGVCLVAWRTPSQSGTASSKRTATVAIALTAALCFGASLYATGRVSIELPLGWALLPARLVGVIAVAAPLAAVRRWRMTRRALPWVLLSGCCEVGGAAAFAIGARHGLAVSAVLASQFATVAVISGAVLFRERLARRQVSGIAAVAIGVGVLSALQA